MEFTTEYYIPVAGNIWDEANVTRPLPPYWSLPTRVCLSSLLALFMLLAIVGNSMVIIVIARHRGMRTRTNLFLCSLALADLLCGLLDMPFSLVTMVKGDWWFSQWACQFNGFAMPFFFVASIHTLMYISIHKYISIKAPFTKILTRPRIWLMIAAAWLWAAVAGYVTIHGLNRVEYKANTAQCGPTYPSDTKTYAHLLLLGITCYLIPLFVMAFCYIDMFREIRAHTHRLKAHATIDRDLVFLQQKRVTVTLFLVLVVFILSWTPFIAYLTYTSVLDDKTIIPPWINPAAYWCGYMNSACNPIIYALRSPAFRDGYRQLLCRPGAYLSTEADTDYSISRRFTRFQNFLRDTLPKSLHGSGSPLGGSSETPSRKNSLTSLTHYLLFPKSRSLSTSSLPNLRTNAVMRPLRDTDLTKATFIGGIPVLTKRGKVVCYQDPGRDTRRRPQSNVYYPDPSRAQQAEKSSKKSGKSKKPEVEPAVDSGETSGLLSSELETSENWQGSQDSSIWKRPMQVEPDIVIHVHGAEDSTAREPRGNRVSSESGFEEGEEAMFVTVAEVERRASATKAEEEPQPSPSPAVKRNSAPLLETSPLPRRRSMEESKCDMFAARTLSEHGMQLAVSPVSKSPSDSCIQHMSQPSMAKSSSDPNLKKAQHKSFRRHILKRLFSKTKNKGGKSAAASPRVHEERNRSASVSPPHRGESSRDQFDYLSPEGAARFGAAERTAMFAKAASDTCLDRPELSQNPDPGTSFKVKEKCKKSKSERVKRKRHTHEPDAPNIQKDMLLPEDTFGGIRKSYSVKVRVRRLPSVERLDCAADESVKPEGHQRKKHKKKAKHTTEEVVLEMEELPRCKTVEEFDFEENAIMPRSTLTKAVAVTDDMGTRVGFYVPESEELPLSPPALFRCASDPCLTFKRVEEKAMKRRETKKRKRHGRQGKARKQHGVSICIFDEDQNDQTLRPLSGRKHSSCKSGKRVKKKTVPENNLLLSVHPQVFRTKSDPAPKSPGAAESEEKSRTFPETSSTERGDHSDFSSCVDSAGSPSPCSSTCQPPGQGPTVGAAETSNVSYSSEIPSLSPSAHARGTPTSHPADTFLASAATYPATSSSGSHSSGLSKASSCNDVNLEVRPTSEELKKASSETMLDVALDAPEKRWSFVGFHTEGTGPDKETFL